MPTNIDEYINKPYVGLPYNKALQQELPFILMFASPNNIIYAPKYFGIGEMVYNEFQGQYNFCIINARVKENKNLMNAFEVKKLPAVFLIDTKSKTYISIDRKHFKKREMRRILTKFKNEINPQ